MRHTLRRLIYVSLGLALVLTVGACSNLFGPGGDDDAQTTGTVQLNLTDAPLDDPNVTGVYINIQTIEYRASDEEDGEWFAVENYDPDNPDNPYDLLALTQGNFESLGSFDIPAGNYDSLQIRLIVAAPLRGGGQPSNPGSYIAFDDDGEFTDGIDRPLFIPSGAQTGVKLTAPAFTVPENGDVTITADFDARRSVVATGGGMDILKPTIRLVVDDQAGEITGTVTGLSADMSYTVLAYEDDTYTAQEHADPDAEESRFPNAVSSSTLEDEDGDGSADYVLPYLAEGTYDLYIAVYDSDGYVGGAPVDGPQDVEVAAGDTVTEDFSLTQ